MKKGKASRKVQKSKVISKWCVESHDGRFVIDRCSDGGLVIVDHALMNPDDDKDVDGIFCVMREDRIIFMELMKKAVAMDVLQDAKVYATKKCPTTVVVRKQK